MFIEKINHALKSVIANTSLASTQNEGTHSIGVPEIIAYIFGPLFIIMGIACFFLYPRSKRNADQYRKEQLEEYNKVKKIKTSDYSRTGMYLPAWEKAKMFAPVFFGLVLCLIGISWLVGQTLFSW